MLSSGIGGTCSAPSSGGKGGGGGTGIGSGSEVVDDVDSVDPGHDVGAGGADVGVGTVWRNVEFGFGAGGGGVVAEAVLEFLETLPASAPFLFMGRVVGRSPNDCRQKAAA